MNAEEFLEAKYAHQKNAKESKFGFYEVISIIEEYASVNTPKPITPDFSRLEIAARAMQGILSSGKFAEGIAFSPAVTEMALAIADKLITGEAETSQKQ